jgi:hypothetical protein
MVGHGVTIQGIEVCGVQGLDEYTIARRCPLTNLCSSENQAALIAVASLRLRPSKNQVGCAIDAVASRRIRRGQSITRVVSTSA